MEDVPHVAVVHAVVKVAVALRTRFGNDLAASAGVDEGEELVVGVLLVGGQTGGPDAGATGLELQIVEAGVSAGGA